MDFYYDLENDNITYIHKTVYNKLDNKSRYVRFCPEYDIICTIKKYDQFGSQEVYFDHLARHLYKEFLKGVTK